MPPPLFYLLVFCPGLPRLILSGQTFLIESFSLVLIANCKKSRDYGFAVYGSGLNGKGLFLRKVMNGKYFSTFDTTK